MRRRWYLTWYLSRRRRRSRHPRDRLGGSWEYLRIGSHRCERGFFCKDHRGKSPLYAFFLIFLLFKFIQHIGVLHPPTGHVYPTFHQLVFRIIDLKPNGYRWVRPVPIIDYDVAHGLHGSELLGVVESTNKMSVRTWFRVCLTTRLTLTVVEAGRPSSNEAVSHFDCPGKSSHVACQR